MEQKTSKNVSGVNLNFWLAMIMFAIVLATILSNITMFSAANNFLIKKEAEFKEAQKPVDFELTIIKDSNCKDCFNITTMLDAVVKQNVNFSNEKDLEASSAEAKDLITKYSIAKLPTFILTGDFEKRPALKTLITPAGQFKDNTFVFGQVGIPYIDASTGAVRGKLKLTLLTNSACKECYDITVLDNALTKQFKAFVEEKRTVDYQTAEGKKLVRTYGIKKIPNMVLDGDVKAYQGLENALEKVGSASSSVYVFKQTGVPYTDIASGAIRGKAKLTIISDASCKECYDTANHLAIVKQFGLSLEDDKKENITVDAASADGQKLIKKYKITKVPMIILKGDMEPYSTLKSIWTSEVKGKNENGEDITYTVGTIENDGAYVFRDGVRQMGIYKDLATGKTIDPKGGQAGQTGQ